MPVTSLDPDFLDHIAEIEDWSNTAAAASNLNAQRQWMYPPLGTWNGNPLDIAGTTGAFDRTALNDLYEDIIANEEDTRIGETMVVKLQIDYLAALERAFRTRHCSSVRARIHASARRAGMGEGTGPFSGGVVLWLQRLLQAAASDPG